METTFKNALLAGTVALLFFLNGCDKKGGAQGPPPGGPPEVGIIEVQPRFVELTTELPGRTAPGLIAEVRPQVGGIVQQRLFTEGSDVQGRTSCSTRSTPPSTGPRSPGAKADPGQGRSQSRAGPAQGRTVWGAGKNQCGQPAGL